MIIFLKFQKTFDTDLIELICDTTMMKSNCLKTINPQLTNIKDLLSPDINQVSLDMNWRPPR